MEIRIIEQTTQNRVEATGTSYAIKADISRKMDSVIDSVYGRLMNKSDMEIGNFQYNPGSNFSVLTYKKEDFTAAAKDASDFIDSLSNPRNINIL